MYTSPLHDFWGLFSHHHIKNLEVDKEVGFLLGKEAIGLEDKYLHGF
jgi:hypothetical protein